MRWRIEQTCEVSIVLRLPSRAISGIIDSARSGMSELIPPTPEQSKPDVVQHTSGGIDINAGEVQVGGDIAGRDVVKQTTIGGDVITGGSTQIQQVGFSPQAVQRLVITVGLMVFVTAACFFAGGVIVGSQAIAALNRPINSNVAAANDFQSSLDRLAAASPNQSFRFAFSEEDLSSYVRFNLGPAIGLSNARARVLSDGQFVFYGSWPGLLNLPLVINASVQLNNDQIFKVNSAAIQLLPAGNSGEGVSSFGWAPVPNFLAQPVIDAVNRELGQYMRIGSLNPPSEPATGGGGGADRITVIQGIRP
jgi:hypothetical protein